MKYFNNPTTEHELKDQYRKLLIKYDYSSEKNAKIIYEIKKEYDIALMQIKRANGYRTTSEKIIDGAKNIHKEFSDAKQAENLRINNLKNHKYTKYEIQNLINDTKQCISKIIRTVVKKQSYDYTNLRDIIKRCDSVQTARWFNTKARKMASEHLSDEYDEIREKLEYALKSQSKDKKSQESYMIQMEKMMGQHIKSIFEKYEKELVDPIIVAEQNIKQVEKTQSRKKEKKFNTILSLLFWIGFVIYLTFELFTNRYMDLELYLFLLIIVTIIELLSYWLMVIIPRRIEDNLNKKTLSGIGARKHNSRVSEKTQYQSDRCKVGLIRLIFKLLGF